jgi:hypothetical protein
MDSPPSPFKLKLLVWLGVLIYIILHFTGLSGLGSSGSTETKIKRRK